MTTIDYRNLEEARAKMNGRGILADREDYDSEESFQAAFTAWKKERGDQVEIVTMIGDLDDDEVKRCIIGPKKNYDEESDYADEYIFM